MVMKVICIAEGRQSGEFKAVFGHEYTVTGIRKGHALGDFMRADEDFYELEELSPMSKRAYYSKLFAEVSDLDETEILKQRKSTVYDNV